MIVAVAPASHPQPHPPRFQRDGWVSTCSRGDDGFAAECDAIKSVGGYTLRISVGDAQFHQSIEHVGCEAASREAFREDAPMNAGAEHRRWVVAAFDQLARDMAARCPKLPPLDRKAYLNPPALNSVGEEDVG
jgi:hypothetical protein